MLSASSETGYRICDCCGKERECYLERRGESEQALCVYCLAAVYCYL